MGVYRCKHLAATVLLTLTSAFAPMQLIATEFRKVQLLSGISLDLPAQWAVKTHEKPRSFTVAEVVKESRNLLLAHSLPLKATVSVSLAPKKKLTAAYLKAMTPERLTAMNAQIIKSMTQGENDGAPKVIATRDLEVTSVSGHPALKSGYLRNGVTVPEETWEVVQLRVPMPDLEVNVRLSWRSDEEAGWRPIMAHIVDSIVIH